LFICLFVDEAAFCLCGLTPHGVTFERKNRTLDHISTGFEQQRNGRVQINKSPNQQINKSTNQQINKNMSFTLPNLPYDFAALEPHVDARTMEIHHDKHHAAYVNNLNAALQGTEHEGKSIETLLSTISTLPPAVRNNGGGHWNHSMFWQIMAPNAGGEPTGTLADAIDDAFGSFDSFKTAFAQAAATRFGSGWAWLSVGADKKLFISSTPNQDNPLMDVAEQKGTPILGLDVWEHAYYLHYQNRRPDYVTAWWNVVNWDAVSSLLVG
jgi:Fe-Mn family superoxide dismutase